MYSGLSQYGWQESNPDWWRCNLAGLNLMKTQFPKFQILSIPIGSLNRDAALNRTRMVEAVEWCRDNNIKAVLSMYRTLSDVNEIRGFWEYMADLFLHQYPDLHDTILAFDIYNEPWGDSYWKDQQAKTMDMFNTVIDAIRAIDPARMCGVQSFREHHYGMRWIETDPIRDRNNILFVAHLYSHCWKHVSETYCPVAGEWQSYWSGSHPWNIYYRDGDYTQGKAVLMDPNLSPSLYNRFGFVTLELGLPFLLTEVASSAVCSGGEIAGMTYLRDVLDILNAWGINWCYHSWFSPTADRPCVLNSPDMVPRPMVSVVNEKLIDLPPLVPVSLTIHAEFDSQPFVTPYEIVETGKVGNTPDTVKLNPGTYTIIVQPTIIIGPTTYRFASWEDGSTNPQRTLNLTADKIITGTYEVATPPPPDEGILEIHAYENSRELTIPYEIVETGRVGSTPDTVTLDPGTYTVNVTYNGKLQSEKAQVIQNTTVRLDFQFITPKPLIEPLFPRVRELLSSTFPSVAGIYDRIDELRLKRQAGALI